MKSNTYRRIVPRDLFNEAKLLKCLGKITLDIYDYKLDLRVMLHGSRFRVEQNSSGDLYVDNLRFYKNDILIWFVSPYNSKDNFPLLYTTDESRIANDTLYLVKKITL